MSHVIRPARPEDKNFLAKIVLLAARSHVEIGVWDLIAPKNEEERIRAIEGALTTEQASWCHWSKFLIAEVDGEPAAALSGYAAYDESLLPMEQVLIAGMKAIGYDDEQVGAAFQRMLVFLECHEDDEKETFIIEWVATLAAFRRQGLVRELLDAILERGRELGHTKAQIGILLGNVSAQRAYENVGFVMTHEMTSPAFEAAIGCPGMARLMIEDLAAL